MRNYHIGYRGENSIYISKISEHAGGGFSNLQIHRYEYEFIRSILAQFSANFLLECWEAFIVRTIIPLAFYGGASKFMHYNSYIRCVWWKPFIHFFKAINVEVFAEKVV